MSPEYTLFANIVAKAIDRYIRAGGIGNPTAIYIGIRERALLDTAMEKSLSFTAAVSQRVERTEWAGLKVFTVDAKSHAECGFLTTPQ